MIALFFEVSPRPGMASRYFEMAAELRPELARNPGLLYIDRFDSLMRPGVFLSHQIWRDEASLARWRANGHHHAAQASGRRNVLADYRLRVADVVAARGPEAGDVGAGLATYNDPSVSTERFVVSVLSRVKPFDDAGGEVFSSVYTKGEFAFVATPANRHAGMALIEEAGSFPEVRSARLSLVSRDYGLHARAEAPQYFPPVTG